MKKVSCECSKVNKTKTKKKLKAYADKLSAKRTEVKK